MPGVQIWFAVHAASLPAFAVTPARTASTVVSSIAAPPLHVQALALAPGEQVQTMHALGHMKRICSISATVYGSPPILRGSVLM